MFNFHTKSVLSFILAILCVFSNSRSGELSTRSWPQMHEPNRYLINKCLPGNAPFSTFDRFSLSAIHKPINSFDIMSFMGRNTNEQHAYVYILSMWEFQFNISIGQEWRILVDWIDKFQVGRLEKNMLKIFRNSINVKMTPHKIQNAILLPYVVYLLSPPKNSSGAWVFLLWLSLHQRMCR